MLGAMWVWWGLLASPAPAADPPAVVVVVLDGVRWQEVVDGADPAQGVPARPLFPRLHADARGTLFPDGRISNPDELSLPGYESLLAGHGTDCHSNHCGRIGEETLPERLVHAGLPRSSVAVITSWATIDLAAEHEPGTVFVNAGAVALDDGTGAPDLAALNLAQSVDAPPWGHARRDEYTMAQALRYLRVHRPRFLFVALNDADEWAHRGDYARYLDTLDRFDRFVSDVAATLDESGDRTLLVVTADHGRGTGAAWRDHGGNPDADRIWMWVRGPVPPLDAHPTHADLRPTVEALFGLPPCDHCGPPLRSFLAGMGARTAAR